MQLPFPSSFVSSIILFSARQCMNSRKNRLSCGLFSISAKQLHLLTSFSVEFIQHFWKSPSVFLTAVFPYNPLFSEFLFYSFIKTTISFTKVEREIIALNSLHFLGNFSSFLKIYSTYLFPFLN